MKPTNSKLKKIIKEELTRTIREEQMIRAIVQEAIATDGNIDEGFMDTMKGAWGKVKSKAGDVKAAAKGMYDPGGAMVDKKKKYMAQIQKATQMVDEFKEAASDRTGEGAWKLGQKYYSEYKKSDGASIVNIINKKIVELGRSFGGNTPEGVMNHLVKDPKKAPPTAKGFAETIAEEFAELQKHAERTLERGQRVFDKFREKGIEAEYGIDKARAEHGKGGGGSGERNDAERTKRWRREADASERKKSDWDSESTRRMMTRGG